MTFVPIPAGTFLMGSPAPEPQRGPDEGPQRRVAITRPFFLATHAVSQQAYERVLGTNPSKFHKANGGGLSFPVEQVSWYDAVAFCQRLSALPAERQAGRRYRLPTEAEWEYACRAGTTTPFHCGSALSAQEANFDASRPYGLAPPGPGYRGQTREVVSYPANAWGLFDMHGNVWEWCADWYDEHAYENGPSNDPTGPASGSLRVLRGGCWNSSGHLCRSARRNKYAPDYRNDTIGFRVVLETA
jgi:formylglycine-generating enzyme required for sulfatase activity